MTDEDSALKSSASEKVAQNMPEGVGVGVGGGLDVSLAVRDSSPMRTRKTSPKQVGSHQFFDIYYDFFIIEDFLFLTRPKN